MVGTSLEEEIAEAVARRIRFEGIPPHILDAAIQAMPTDPALENWISGRVRDLDASRCYLRLRDLIKIGLDDELFQRRVKTSLAALAEWVVMKIEQEEIARRVAEGAVVQSTDGDDQRIFMRAEDVERRSPHRQRQKS